MAQRLRAMWATASSAPWRRAPLLLRRLPGVAIAFAGATAVLVAAVAAVPLFLSSAGTAAVALQVDERCPRDTGVTFAGRAAAEDLPAADEDPFAPLDDLDPANRSLQLELVRLGGPTATLQTSLLHRDDALDHVEVLDGPVGDGIWITDRAAAATGLAVGDTARVGELDAPVGAIYRDLGGDEVDRFWCANADLVLVEARGGELVLPPPVVLVDRATFLGVMESIDSRDALATVTASLAPDGTLADVDALVRGLACREATAADLVWCDDGQPGIDRQFGGRGVRAAGDDAQFVTRFFRSSLPFVTARTRAIQTSVGSSIWPVASLAAIAGAGLVAAATSLWFDRRRREIALLAVRGVSPTGLATKAVLEASIPLAVGAAAGVLLAYGAVLALGPSSVLEATGARRAAAISAFALVAAALTIAAVVVVRTRTRPERRRRLGLVPWEVALVALAVVSYQRLGEWGVPVGRGASVSRVDVLGLLFPVLFLTAAVAVVGRLLAIAVTPLRAISARWPISLRLAVRRLARSRTAAIGVVAATALAVGVLVYAATMDRSLHATLDAKAATFVGSDVAVRVGDDTVVPPGLAARATRVEVHSPAYVDVDGDRREVTILAIDPATFGAVAFWDETFSSTSFDEILRRLAVPGDGDQTPALLVGLDGASGQVIAGVGDGVPAELALEGVADVDAFAGMKRGKPTVYVPSTALDRFDIAGGRTELWLTGEREATFDELRAAGIAFEEIRSATEIADRSAFVTISWTFGFMRSLGIAAGALALGGVAVHLDGRRRERVLAHALLRRMGLGERAHRRALAAELVGSVLVGCVVGLAGALTGAWLAHGRIDPVPGPRPDPLLRPALDVVAIAGVVAVVVVVLAAVVAQRRAERDDPVEVLRGGA